MVQAGGVCAVADGPLGGGWVGIDPRDDDSRVGYCGDVRLCASRQRAKVSARLRSNAILVDSKWILSDCSSNRDFFVLMQAPYQNMPACREHFDKC